MPSIKKTFRDCVSSDPNETVVFAVDITSQPQYQKASFHKDPFIYTKCSRALPIARDQDIVVLIGDLDEQYYQWLRSVNLGPAKVVAYGHKEPGRSLPGMIRKEPEPVLAAIRETAKSPVYLPFYCSEKEILAANVLGASLFGCDEEVTKKFFNKESFKDECLQLKLPTVPGAIHTMESKKDRSNLEQLEELALLLLNEYSELVVRGAEGAAGSSVYTMDQNNLEEIKEKIASSTEKSFLLEPKLPVVSSPNDQWLIDRNGDVHYLGLSAQLFNDLKHVGNLKGLYFARKTSTLIKKYSLAMVKLMRKSGYRGVIGIDYIVTDKGIFPIENNARLNGSTFTISLAEEIEKTAEPTNCWKFFKAQTFKCSFNDLQGVLGDLLYQPGHANFVFPIDCDTLPIDGKFTPVLFGEDFYHLEYLERMLEQKGIRRY